jgi:hypothetical protein
MVAERIGPIEPESDEAKLVLRALNHPVEVTVGDQVFRIDRIRNTGLPPVDPERQLAAIRALADVLKESPTFDADEIKAEIRRYRDLASEGRFGDE